MQPRKSAVFLIILAVLSAAVAGLSTKAVGTVIERFVVTLVFGALGLFMADASKIRGSMIVATDDTKYIIRTVAIYGLAPGLILGAINYFFFFGYRYSPYVLPRIRNMTSAYDAFLLSMESGLTEEVIYRLFFLSCILYTCRQLYARLKLPLAAAPTVSATVALLGSSLIFAMAHRSPYSLNAAFWGGLVLGGIYLMRGVEASIAAHFVADFLFFSASYLYRSL